MDNLNITKHKSNFFNFKKTLSFKLHTISKFEGWNGLVVINLNISKGEILDDNYIKKNFSEIANKEKILVVTKGKLSIKYNKKNLSLNSFDALNFFSDQNKYEITCEEDSTAFLISAKKLNVSNGDLKRFNFKNDIKSIDLWGGQCISRPYEGKDLNLVLFDLKPGFKFEDKGHHNEQVTWLVNGEMNFHADGRHKKLTTLDGVDIGPHHVHGGISNGAIGFDAFFPKREEKKYKNT